MNHSQVKAEAICTSKGKRPLTMLTAYDYPTARLLDESGVDMILVGDSVGMVVLGFEDTTHVTLSHMMHHVAAVARGVKRAMLIADLPIHTYETPTQAVETARQLVEAGADAVKLEGGLLQEAKIAAIIGAGIPVVGHVGLLPQRVLQEGGYKIKGKTPTEIEALREDIHAVNRVGVCCCVVEGVRPEVASMITDLSSVPTIGIGSGKGTCDGEVAVVSDLVGAFPWFVPSFIKPKANVAGEISQAAQDWMNEVRDHPHVQTPQ
ncbi:MAG: 3-methyl-2-oxobutanoate hydroxymethyltransferase [Akkermansia sp.]